MFVNLAIYTVECAVSTVTWTGKTIYRYFYPIPPDPLLLEMTKELKETKKEIEELKKLILNK